ncbi:MAG: hypothetical protein GXO19_06405 [Epsilonproteobacteria bacterium]|nr:hypothetical protein [Campylobacterota bacterium]
MGKRFKRLIPMYLLLLFLVASILFIFLAPLYMVKRVNEDAQKPKGERELIYRP